MSKIKLELDCEISEDQNSATLFGVKYEFVGSVCHADCTKCDFWNNGCGNKNIPCCRDERTDSRNGHWRRCEGVDEVRHSDEPLGITIKDDMIIIQIGIERLDGHGAHPFLPALTFDDRMEWAKDVVHEITREEEDGNSPLVSLFDNAMTEAIEQGSNGLSEYSASHVGTCTKCGEHCEALTHIGDHELCNKCKYKQQSAEAGRSEG